MPLETRVISESDAEDYQRYLAYGPVQPEHARWLTFPRYTVIPVGPKMPDLISEARAVCTMTAVLGPRTLFGAHYIPQADVFQEGLVDATFEHEPGPKFGVIVTSAADTQRARDLAETVARVSGGRAPDIVWIPHIFYHDRTDEQKSTPNFGQLVHHAEVVKGRLIHTFEVPGTSYYRQGTLEELNASEPVTVTEYL